MGDIAYDEMTGDTLTYDFHTRVPARFDARAGDIYVLPDHRVKLSFDIIGDTKDIDFIVISAKKEGEFFSVGPAHCEDDQKVVNYVDFTNVDYLGRVDYYAQAVFETGNISEMSFIGSAALINKRG
jgi:hypothetical protein